MGAFRFSLEPALEQARAEQDACEAALVAARRELAAVRRQSGDLRENLEHTRQQLAAEHDNLGRLSGGGLWAEDFAAYSRFLAALRARQTQQADALRRQVPEVRFAEQKVALRQEELRHATRRVDALQRLRGQERQAFECCQRQAEERAQDELGSLRAAERRHPS